MALLHLSLALFLLAVPLLLLASAASDPIHADASAARTRAHHLHHGASELSKRAAAGMASRGTPIYPGVPGEVAASHVAERQHHLEMALVSLGFNDMAATLLTDSPALAWWPGAVTIFAPPDDLLRAFCPGPRYSCCRDLLLRHVVLGHFPYDILASPSTVTLPSVHVGSCLDVSSEPGTRRRGRIVYVHGVEIADPEVYNHGDFIIHAIRRVLPPLHRCLETRPPLLLSATAAATVPIRGAIARLGRSGYGFVALALRALSGELRASTSYFTVFAVADDAILAGGAADYVWGVRFHIVPGRRLTHADLLHLHPGTVLPTLGGDGYNLVVTHGADDDVFVNHVGIKEAEVVTTARLVVHGVHSSLLGASASKLNQDHLWSGATSASGNAMADATTGLAASKLQIIPVARTKYPVPAPADALSYRWAIGAALATLLIPLACLGKTTYRWFKALPSVEGQELKKYEVCQSCTDESVKWVTSCCQLRLCSECFCDVFLTRHRPGLSRRPCFAPGTVGTVNEAGRVVFETNHDFYRSSEVVTVAEQSAKRKIGPLTKVQARIYTSSIDLHAREPPRRKLKVEFMETNQRRRLCKTFLLKKKPYARSFLSFPSLPIPFLRDCEVE